MRGEMYYIRYADDFLVFFENENDAKRVYNVLGKRLAKYGLELAKDKTRILPFGRNSGKGEEFDFLGFTYFNAKTRQGRYRLGVRSSQKKLKTKRKAVKEWIKEHRIIPVDKIMRILNAKLTGHYAYYGINGNFDSIENFVDFAKITAYKWLNRRSQRKSIGWKKFSEIWQKTIRKPKIMVQIWN